MPPIKDAAEMMAADVREGPGPLLLLVGGGLTGWTSWVSRQERLAGTRWVARVQPLNVQHGLEGRAVPAGYSLRSESEALARTAADLSPRAPVDLVGWSYGASAALVFALDHPERIRTLTLIEPSAFWILDAGGPLDEVSRREIEETRALFAATAEDVTEEHLASLIRSMGLCPPEITPQELPRWLPRAQVLELPGGHAPQIVAEDAFLEHLARFQANGAPTTVPSARRP